MKLGKNTSRHPAVVDLLGGAPTPSPDATSDAVAPSVAVDDPLVAPVVAARDGSAYRTPRRARIVAATALAGLLAAALTGIVWGATGGDSQSSVAATQIDGADTPMLELSDAPAAPVSDLDDECRADRGDQRSGAGVIAAWNYAYYVRRDAVAARALATPNSSVVPAEQLQPFIDAIPVGTNYCVRTKPLSQDVYLVDLSELRPDGVHRITQTVTTAQIDGKWFVDVFS